MLFNNDILVTLFKYYENMYSELLFKQRNQTSFPIPSFPFEVSTLKKVFPFIHSSPLSPVHPKISSSSS